MTCVLFVCDVFLISLRTFCFPCIFSFSLSFSASVSSRPPRSFPSPSHEQFPVAVGVAARILSGSLSFSLSLSVCVSSEQEAFSGWEDSWDRTTRSQTLCSLWAPYLRALHALAPRAQAARLCARDAPAAGKCLDRHG